MTDIWQNAPEDATHYSRETGFFYKLAIELYVYYEGKWIISEYNDNYSSLRLILRPATLDAQKKSNELPPVGSHLEFKWGSKRVWYECIILPESHAAYKNENGNWHTILLSKDSYYEFRPIKSEREKAIDEIKKIVVSQGWLSSGGTVSGEIAEKLYDAGLRFTK